MFSWGMFSALAARIAVRSRGFPSGSPPPRAAIVISLMIRVNILPRLASSAPFLCLIVAHFEWPDITTSDESKDGGAPAPDHASITQEDPCDPAASRLHLAAFSARKFACPAAPAQARIIPRPGCFQSAISVAALAPGCSPARCGNSSMQITMKQAIAAEEL